jgi:hypothetical protein
MPKFASLRDFATSLVLWLKWLPLTVALMSGAFSLYRELYGLYIGVIPPKSLFWESMLIAFIISSAIAWAQERMKYLAEVKKGHNPNISITVHQVSVAFKLIEAKPEPAAFILTILSVRNTGAPSIVDTWLMAMADPKIKVMKITVGEDLQWPYAAGMYTFSKNDHIHKKTAEDPVPAGGKRVGFMLWRVEGLDHKSIIDDKEQLSKLTITARDVNGTLITAKNKAISFGAPIDGELLDYYPGMQGP